MSLKIFFNISIMGLLLGGFTACDSGDIFPSDNSSESKISMNIIAKYKLTNTEAFPENYKLAFATFSQASSNPTSVILLNKPSNDTLTAIMTEIPANTLYVGLCVFETTGNRNVFLFRADTINASNTSLNLPLREVNLAPYARMQTQLFSQCLLCHGASNTTASGLYLTENESYNNLVNKPASLSAKNRVTPNSLNSSFLYDVLTDKDLVLSYKHTDISTLRNDDINLLKAWIKSGANQ